MKPFRLPAPSGRCRYYADLTTGITGAVRKKKLVVAARAARRDRDVHDTQRTRMVGDQSAEINRARRRRRLSRELTDDLGAHLVAFAADRWSQVHAELRGRKAPMCQGRDSAIDDTSRGTPP